MFVSASKAILSVCSTQLPSLPSGMTSSVDLRLRTLPSSSMPRRNIFVVELVGLELDALVMLVLEVGSTRRRRAGAATVAMELDEANTVIQVSHLDGVA
eukprot:3725711-Pleurochrysis_carterae.AAC.1